MPRGEYPCANIWRKILTFDLEWHPLGEENKYTPQNDFLVSKNENTLTENFRSREKPVITVQSPDIQSMEELDQKVEESYTKVAPGCYTCKHCDKSFKNPSHIKEHVEKHFEGLSFPCSLCDTIVRSRLALRIHSKRKHFS